MVELQQLLHSIAQRKLILLFIQEGGGRVSSRSDCLLDTDRVASGIVEDAKSPLTVPLEQNAGPTKTMIRVFISENSSAQSFFT